MKNAKSFKYLFFIKEEFYPKNTHVPWFLNTSLIYFGDKFLQQIQAVFSLFIKTYILPSTP